MPTIYPNSGTISREHGKAYVDAKVAHYVANNYHKPSDEMSDEWDLSGAVEDLNLYYAMGRMLVDNMVWPNWVEGSAFKAMRDKQRSE